MARHLGAVGPTGHWGTMIDRSLLKPLRQASERADAVIANGGLGSTVDSLSQEVAAEGGAYDPLSWNGRLRPLKQATPVRTSDFNASCK
jgi:molybdopterin-biosynthesis enzyme MoeA-like protein